MMPNEDEYLICPVKIQIPSWSITFHR